MARLRRMYARPLFVVVGIFGPVLAPFGIIQRLFPDGAFAAPLLRLGFPGAYGYTLAA